MFVFVLVLVITRLLSCNSAFQPSRRMRRLWRYIFELNIYLFLLVLVLVLVMLQFFFAPLFFIAIKHFVLFSFFSENPHLTH